MATVIKIKMVITIAIIIIKLIRNGMIMMKELLIFSVSKSDKGFAWCPIRLNSQTSSYTKSNNNNDAVKIINSCDYDCNNDGNSHNNL